MRRITAQALARMLQAAWASPVMPELVGFAAHCGVDGTAAPQPEPQCRPPQNRQPARCDGCGRICHAQSGRRYVLVAIVNHPNANAARPVLDALTD